MSDCLFCRMVAGEEPLSLVYDDDLTFALIDIQPVTPGHLVVVPKRHAADLAELEDEDADALIRVARRAAAALRGSGLFGFRSPPDYSVRPRRELDENAAGIREAWR